MTIKEYVADKKTDIRNYTEALEVKPSLTIIQVGDVEASTRYVRNKVKDATECGINAEVKHFAAAITTEELIDEISTITSDGIIVQLPLPDHVDVQAVTDAIPVDKDIDGFKQNSPFTPCTPGGIMDYLDSIGFEFEGKHAVVLGRSEIVGKPMVKLLTDRNMTVSWLNSHTPESLKNTLLREADLVVCAVGKRGVMSSQKALKAFIVDVGINFNEEGKLCGDVEVNDLDKDRVTPVPGGVGLLTRLKLMHNTIQAYRKLNG